MKMYTKISLFVQVLLLLLISIVSCSVLQNRNLNHDPDIFRNVSEIIAAKGYPVEVHTVQTSDGYLLCMQRIPHGKNDVKRGKRPAVYLQHGLLSSSADFILNLPEQSLGFILADEGYDVWLGNTRGNTYSKRHIKLKPSMNEFWNFSFQDMAEHDLPAMIDYVLNVTEEEQLFYIGHSQGTTAAFALLSENPTYNKKVKLYSALAPVATVGYITSAIKYLAPFAKEINFLLELLGVKDFLPSGPLMKFLSEEVCDTEIKLVCEDVVFLFFGFDQKQLNESRLAAYTAHSPAGSSTKSVVHYAQMVNSKKFQKFDYGKDNIYHYNQDTPPEYDLSKITTPTALYWSLNDDLADFVDVGLLQRKLKSMVKSYFVPDKAFNHVDFVTAVEARKLLYDELIATMNKYN